MLALLVACGKTIAQPPADPPPKQQTTQVRIEGVVKIGEPDPRHRVTPVEIVEDGGKRWLASYQADELWKAFDGRRVEAEGETYVPEGQAILLPHVRIERWRIPKPGSDDPIVSVGPPVKMHGKLGPNPAPPGSKAAVETSPHFLEDGGKSYPIAHGTPGELGKTVEIEARLVELSPFGAHIGGPHLWILP